MLRADDACRSERSAGCMVLRDSIGKGRGYAMKVVLFCGGMGLRMREASERTPKPMIPIGNRPLLLHLMKYYAHFGHTEFIL